MSAMSDQLSLFGDPEPVDPIEPVTIQEPVDTPRDPDLQARAYAVDPRHHVVLEASAGTGKTSVLVQRYVNLLKAGVDPANILAITFTRKAAAEMRERIVRELRESAERSEFDKARWVELRDRLGDIAISTIDAFCLSLLREFPLEADLDPGFDMADETEVPRLMEESLDRSMRVLTGMARTDADVALVLAQLGISRTREGLASLLDRRLVAWDALNRFLVRGPADLTAEVICRRAATSLQDVLRTVPGGLATFLDDGPVRHPRYPLLLREIERLGDVQAAPDAVIRGVLDRIAAHFLTNEGKARRSGQIYPYKAPDYSSPDAAKRHRAALFQVAPAVERVVYAFNRDLNVVLARGIRKMFTIALDQYRRALEERSVLDFSDVLQRALQLLRQMDEFAQSRFRLEARYHHVLVDEFQDTSRAQWELVALLIQSWGEGLGLATQPSIFIVGDRKQSIYRFRDAEVAVLQQAARFIEGLRPQGSPRRSITRSFRAVPGLLQFVNDVFEEVAAEPATRPDDFSYGDGDRFPVDLTPETGRGLILGIAAAEQPEACAAAVADEIVRILKEEDVRDKKTGVPRRATPGDIAILFRSRSSHREFEHELEARGIPTYVYKGLGFFDADETKDVLALIRFLADPASNLRAAALLRSRFIRISDRGLAALAPDLAAAVTTGTANDARLDADDRHVLDHARPRVQRWLDLADRVPPADLVEQILRESAYAYELRGPRRMQAWENLKKMRSLVRRIQNRGYATLRRIADHIDALTAGDESNAVIEALDAVNLMTVHASKGLEFPIVFVVNMAKGASGPPKPVRVIVSGDEEPSVSIGPFVSDMDDIDRVRERHEGRRLLYVALTRARDRLYLSSALKKGAVAAGRGSLAEVLPESICGLFARAASAFPEAPTVAWTSSASWTFEFRICRPAAAAAVQVESVVDGRPGVFVRPTVAVPPRRTVTQMVRAASPVEVHATSHGASVGMLVHRLIRQPNVLEQTPEQQERLAREWVRRQVDGGGADSEAVVQAALRVIRRPATRERMLALLGSGEPFFEVPFSFAHEGGVVRGSIDCLIRSAGRIQIVEFKTGSSAPEHEIQRDVYVRAARSMFPDAIVEGHLIYL
jgi:ATP-dependent helicase/nuclease subunit A